MAGQPIAEFLASLDQALRLSAGRRERVLREVEDHLVDAAAGLVTVGLSPAQAEAEAVARFGSAGHIARRFPPDPLGVAQHASGGYDTWRLNHPWLSLTATFLAGLVVLKLLFRPLGLVALGTILLPSFVVLAIVNRRLRNQAEAGFRRRLSAHMGSRPSWSVLMVLGPLAPLGIGASLAWGPHPLLTTMLGELVFVAVVVIFQPNWATGWSARHPGAAHNFLVAGWTAALGFPGAIVVISGFSQAAVGTAFVLCSSSPSAPRPGRRCAAGRPPTPWPPTLCSGFRWMLS